VSNVAQNSLRGEGGAGRRESARANSRAALIEAAFEEFSARGYEAATVAGIAERAGVTTGALYAHFAGKLELLLETVGLTPVEDMVRTVAEITARPWSEAARMLSEEMAAQPDRRTQLLLDVIVAARRDPAVAQILRQGLDHYLEAMGEATKVGMALGLIDPALATDDLNRVLALINLGMIVFAALGERPPTPEAFARLADLLLQSSGGHHGEQPAALARVSSRAGALEQSREALAEAVAAAAMEGHSLRQIGAAAGMSHERVRQVLLERPD
jgi:AcrR family transcriptional regulator